MRKRIDLTGKIVGRLIVLSYKETRKTGRLKQSYEAFWLCRCSCGNEVVVSGHSLKRNTTRSCGCLAKEVRSEQFKMLLTKHGMCGTKEYECWANVIKRAGNPDIPYYENRPVCEEWKSFENFLKDMGLHPDRDNKWTIERIDNELGYFKENCIWALSPIQTRNVGIRKDNTSGAVGVCLCANRPYPCWTAHWSDTNGKLRTKSFSISKYGNDEAFNMALDFRKQQIELLNDLGQGYSQKHGHQR